MCTCRLKLAWISSKTSTKLLGMPTYPDRSSWLLWTLSHANSSLCCPVSTDHSRHPSPTASSEFLCPTPLTGVPFLLPVMSRPRVQILCLVSRTTYIGILRVLVKSFNINISYQLWITDVKHIKITKSQENKARERYALNKKKSTGIQERRSR